jgi:hypothetical protein
MTTIGANKCNTSDKTGQKWSVVTVENSIEYEIYLNVKKNVNIYSLYTTNDSGWSAHYKNKLLIIIEDDGNGYKIKYNDDDTNEIKSLNKHPKHMDYCFIENINILLMFINSRESNVETYKFIQH